VPWPPSRPTCFWFPTVLPPVALRVLRRLSRRSARREACHFPSVSRPSWWMPCCCWSLCARAACSMWCRRRRALCCWAFLPICFAPFVAPLAHADLVLPAMWGGIITGIGYGMVLRAGANTGGSDTIGQIISR
jgi:Uncharacterized conserved protein